MSTTTSGPAAGTRRRAGAVAVVPGARGAAPYAEQPTWSELWEACVVVLDRYPRLRRVPDPAHPVLGHVTIPQAAADAAEVHFHLD
jgi:hypothetical protein